VAGPQYPADIDWPANVERLDHVPPAEHPAFYAASRFTLNVTRRDMVQAGWSPSVRLFEAGACGAPVISDVWPGIGELFEPGAEIVLAQSPEHVLFELERPDDDRRDRLAQASRARILKEHTSVQRAEALASDLLRVSRRRGIVPLRPSEPAPNERDAGPLMNKLTA
jgi:spore maturation protein CgeB